MFTNAAHTYLRCTLRRTRSLPQDLDGKRKERDRVAKEARRALHLKETMGAELTKLDSDLRDMRQDKRESERERKCLEAIDALKRCERHMRNAVIKGLFLLLSSCYFLRRRRRSGCHVVGGFPSSRFQSLASTSAQRCSSSLTHPSSPPQNRSKAYLPIRNKKTAPSPNRPIGSSPSRSTGACPPWPR